MEITIKLNPEEKGDRNLLAVILAEIVGSTQPKAQAISTDTVMAIAQPQTKSEQFETVASQAQTTAPAKPKKVGRTTKPAPQAEPNAPVSTEQPAPAPEPMKVESPASEPVKVVTSDAQVVTVSEQPQQPRQALSEQAETKTDVTYDDIRNIIKAFVLEADVTFVRQVLEYELDVTSAKNLKPEEYGKAYAVLEKALKNYRENNKEQ